MKGGPAACLPIRQSSSPSAPPRSAFAIATPRPAALAYSMTMRAGSGSG
jgi:hypothetical protein